MCVQEGLRGCGPTCAFAIAKYGLGAALLRAANLPHDDLCAAIESWRNRLRTILATDPNDFIGSKRCRLGANIPNAFPSVDTIKLYASPAITQFPSIVIARSRIDPDISRLSFLCEQRFGFGKDILSVCKHLFPSVLMSALLDGSAASAAAVFVHPLLINVRTREEKNGILHAEVEININDFIRKLNEGREEGLNTVELQAAVDRSRPWKGWIPDFMLTSYLSHFSGENIVEERPYALAGSSVPLAVRS